MKLKIAPMAFNSIYLTLDSVVKSLVSSDVYHAPEVQKLLSICVESNIVGEQKGEFASKLAVAGQKPCTVPFVVIEGLDGTGKTTLAAAIKRKYGMKPMQTPPSHILEYRPFFDDQPESIRRAYYSLGNYLAAENVMQCEEPIIMDRFWHSTAAYAFGNELKKNPHCASMTNIDCQWPFDLVKPNIVIFLVVSEEERLRRHRTRVLETNTAEEQALAKDALFRENIIDFYRNIRGTNFVEVNADNCYENVQNTIFEQLEESFPSLIDHVPGMVG